MAEYVERKFTAAKLSVALAIAAVLGGLAARDQTAGATGAAADKGPSPHMAEGSVTTREIKNESLLFEDFKANQVYSDNQVNKKFLKITEANKKFVTLDQAVDVFIKGEDAARTYL